MTRTLIRRRGNRRSADRTARSGRILVVLLLAASMLAFWVTRAGTSDAHVSDAYLVRVYTAGEYSVYQVFTFSTSALLCDVSSYAGNVGVDPVKLEFADRQHPGRVCVWPELNKVLPPPGKYEVTLTIVVRGVTSEESARVPFVISEGQPMTTPAGVKVYR